MVVSSGAKTLLAALLAIVGATFAVGVLVSAPSGVDVAEAPDAGQPPRRPHLRSDEDVRQAQLHRVHLEAKPEKLTCDKCHEPTGKEYEAPLPARCLECHEEHEPGVHQKDPAAQRCISCHDFALVGDATAKARDCLGCHAKRQNERRAIEIHKKEDCLRCHAIHKPEQQRPSCLECHEKQGTGHRAKKEGNEVCFVCHVPHTPAAEAKGGCRECHGKEDPLVPVATALFKNGHDECTKCHASHDRTKATVERCTKCHEHQPVLAAEKVAEHQACTSCHNQHDPLGAPASRCVQCHKKVASSHPLTPGGQVCTGCHRPHDRLAEPGKVVLACTTGCHSDRRKSASSHGTAGCPDCHVPHSFKLTGVGIELCHRCHDKVQGKARVIATSTGHSDCKKCHTEPAHNPAAPRPACGSCHEDKAKRVSEGHSKCQRCHETHSGKRLAEAQTCGGCHKDEALTAPKGHADCQKCHEVHVKARRPEAANCAGTCHKDRVTLLHGAIEGGCQNCHRPHGPKGLPAPPECTKCHPLGERLALHGVKDHQKCRSCHHPHESARPQRQECLGCHKDRMEHEAEAISCLACHPFGTKQ